MSRDDDGDEVPSDVAYERGHIAVWLHRHKRTGGYALTRFQEDDLWLLVNGR